MAQTPEEYLSGRSPIPYEGEDITTPIPASRVPRVSSKLERSPNIQERNVAQRLTGPTPLTSKYKYRWSDEVVAGSPRSQSVPASPLELAERAWASTIDSYTVPEDYYTELMTFRGRRIDKPTWGEIIGSYFRRENWIKAGVISPALMQRDSDDPDFDSKEYFLEMMAEMKAVHGWASITRRFTNKSMDMVLDTGNQRDFDRVFESIVRTLDDKNNQDAAGFLKGLAASIIIAPFDPLNYLPIGFVTKPGKLVLKAGKAIAGAVRKPTSLLPKRLASILDNREFKSAMMDHRIQRHIGRAEKDSLGRLAKPNQFGPQPALGPPAPEIAKKSFSLGKLAWGTGKVLVSRTGFGKAALAATPPILLSEAALQNLDPQRTADESAMNIGATILFTWGLLGVRDFARFINKARGKNTFNPSGLLSDIPRMLSPAARTGRNLWGGKDLPELASISKRTKELNDEATDLQKAIDDVDQQIRDNLEEFDPGQAPDLQRQKMDLLKKLDAIESEREAISNIPQPRDFISEYNDNTSQMKLAEYLIGKKEGFESKFADWQMTFNKSTAKRGPGHADTGALVAAQVNPAEKTVNLDLGILADKFRELAWINPKLDGVKAFDRFEFKSYEEWIKFVLEHEVAHLDHPQAKGEPDFAYENRINEIALGKVREERGTVYSQHHKSTADVPHVMPWLDKKHEGAVWRPQKFKVISGGQTGGDIAGLRGARDANVEVGGWIPKGKHFQGKGQSPRHGLSQDARDQMEIDIEAFGLIETESSGYLERTELNASNSDGTVFVAVDMKSRGLGATKRYAEKAGKPFLLIDMKKTDLPNAIKLLKEFIVEHKIETLNVAGNREHSSGVNKGWTPKGIEAYTQDLIRDTFQHLSGRRSDLAGLAGPYITKTLFGDVIDDPNAPPTVDVESVTWQGGLRNSPVYTDKGINTMRTSDPGAKQGAVKSYGGSHFGNPFSHAGYAGTIKVKSVKKAIEFYKRWLQDDWAGIGQNELKIKERVLKEPGFVQQREWIIAQVKSGKLSGTGKKLLYDFTLHKENKKVTGEGPASHADALAEFVKDEGIVPRSIDSIDAVKSSHLKRMDDLLNLRRAELSRDLDMAQNKVSLWNANLPAGLNKRIDLAKSGLSALRALKMKYSADDFKTNDQPWKEIPEHVFLAKDPEEIMTEARFETESTSTHDKRFITMDSPEEGLWEIERLFKKEIFDLKVQLRDQYFWRVIQADVEDFGSDIGILFDNQFTSKEDMIRRMATIYYMIDNEIELHRNAIPIMREYSIYNKIVDEKAADDVLNKIKKQKDILLKQELGDDFKHFEYGKRFWDKTHGDGSYQAMVKSQPHLVKFFEDAGEFAKAYVDASDTAAGKVDFRLGNTNEIAISLNRGVDLGDYASSGAAMPDLKPGFEPDLNAAVYGPDTTHMTVKESKSPVVVAIDIPKIYRAWVTRDWIHDQQGYDHTISSYEMFSNPDAGDSVSGFDLLAFGGEIKKGKLVFKDAASAADSFLRFLSFTIEHELIHADQYKGRGRSESSIATDRLGRPYVGDVNSVKLENITNYLAYTRAVGIESDGSSSPFGIPYKASREPHTDSLVMSDIDILGDLDGEYMRRNKPSRRAVSLARRYGIEEGTTAEIVKDGTGSKVVQWMTKVANPGFQIADSPSPVMRRLVPKLINTPWFYKNEIEGFTNGSSVQARASTYIGYVHQALRHHKVHFGNWRKRVAGERNLWMSGRFNFKLNEEFNGLVGRAMRADRIAKGIGDPEVLESARAFRDHVYDPMIKQIVNVGAIDPDVVKDIIKLNGSYYHRVYNKIKLGESQTAFIEHIATYFEKNNKLSRKEALEAATNTYAKLMSSPDGSHLPGDISVRGANRDRTLEIPDEYLEDWLVDDIELVSMNYTKTWGTDVELRRTFGDPSMALQIAEVKKDFNKLIKEWSSRSDEGSQDVVVRLEESKVDHIEKLKGIRDKMRGMDDLPLDPSSILHRVPGVIRGFAYSAQSGSFLLSNIPDMANTVAFYGLNRTFGSGWVQYVDNFANLSMNRDQAASLAIAIERVKGPVLAEMIGTQSVYGRPMSRATDNSSLFHRMFDKVESASYKTAQISNSVNLMAPWADVCQMVTYLTSQDFILDAALNASKGKAIDKLDMAKLAKMGLDKDSLSKIWSQFDKYGLMEGKKENIPVANMKDWQDSDTLLKFQGAMKIAQDLTNMAPGPGDRPLGLTGPWGKLATMYWGFGFAAMSRIGVQRMQLKDQAAIQGTMMQLGLGAMVVYLKHIASGNSWEQVPDNMIAQTVDKSGILAWIANADILFGILSNGTVGINAWTNHPNAEFSIEAMLRTVLGPGGAIIESAAKSMFGIPADLLTSGKLSSGTVSDLRNTIPFVNVFYLSALFNTITANEDREKELNPERDDWNPRGA